MSYLREIKNAARGNVDEAALEQDIRRCIDAYKSGYRSQSSEYADWDKIVFADKQNVKDGKRLADKMANRADKLKGEIESIFRASEYSDFLFFAGAVVEELPEVQGELEKRNSGASEMTVVSGYDVLVEELAALSKQLNLVKGRLDAIASERAPRPANMNKVRRLVLDLAEVYREHTGREPASGSQGGDTRGDSPFVRYVKAVFETYSLEAKDRQLGDSIYQWLRLDRRIRSDINALEG